MSKYVIVGASAAGIGAIEAIREVDPVGTITVISEELYPQYSRPMIAHHVPKPTGTPLAVPAAGHARPPPTGYPAVDRGSGVKPPESIAALYWR